MVVNGSGDLSGSVDIADGYAVVSDKYNDEYHTVGGASYIFEKTINQYGEEAWVSIQTLYRNDPWSYQAYSDSCACAIVGGPGDDDYGAAYFFELNDATATWEQADKVIGWESSNWNLQQYGFSVSIDEVSCTAIVGGYGTTSYEGAIYIFI